MDRENIVRTLNQNEYPEGHSYRLISLHGLLLCPFSLFSAKVMQGCSQLKNLGNCRHLQVLNKQTKTGAKQTD